MARTICGTRTVLSAPPANRMYNELGTDVARPSMSACREVLPRMKTMSITRTSPRIREIRVPDAIRALAETSFLVVLTWLLTRPPWNVRPARP